MLNERLIHKEIPTIRYKIHTIVDGITLLVIRSAHNAFTNTKVAVTYFII